MRAFVFKLAFLIPFISFSQLDNAFIAKLKSFDTADILKLDTASVPDDAFTAKIKELRTKRKG